MGMKFYGNFIALLRNRVGLRRGNSQIKNKNGGKNMTMNMKTRNTAQAIVNALDIVMEGAQMDLDLESSLRAGYSIYRPVGRPDLGRTYVCDLHDRLEINL